VGIGFERISILHKIHLEGDNPKNQGFLGTPESQNCLGRWGAPEKSQTFWGRGPGCTLSNCGLENLRFSGV